MDNIVVSKWVDLFMFLISKTLSWIFNMILIGPTKASADFTRGFCGACAVETLVGKVGVTLTCLYVCVFVLPPAGDEQ